jgi:hypothetical protein
VDVLPVRSQWLTQIRSAWGGRGVAETLFPCDNSHARVVSKKKDFGLSVRQSNEMNRYTAQSCVGKTMFVPTEHVVSLKLLVNMARKNNIKYLCIVPFNPGFATEITVVKSAKSLQRPVGFIDIDTDY